MTMGALPKGKGRDTSMSNQTARHGPLILQHLGGGTASSAPAAKPACPPRLRRAVHGAVLALGKSGRPPAFAAPTLKAIAADPACRRLGEAIPRAMEKARAGLRAGRVEAELQGEIRDIVMDDVRNLAIGDALEDARRGLLGDDQHEDAMYLGAIAASVAEHLAAEVIVDAAAEPGQVRTPAELARDALLSAEPTLLLIVRIVAALAGAAAEYVRGLKADEKGDPKTVMINAVAEALERIGAPAALHSLQPQGDPKDRRSYARMSDRISREIVRQLLDPQAKIDGQDAEGEQEA